MKKTLIFLGITVFIILVISLVISFLNLNLNKVQIQVPQVENRATSNSQNLYSSFNNELSITVPSDYTVSTSLHKKDNVYTHEYIFVATSSEDLLTIKKVPDEDNLNLSQFEAVNLFYETFQIFEKNRAITKEDTKKPKWNGPEKVYLGQNYFFSENGEREQVLDGRLIKDYIRQYITYYNNEAYFIEFVTFYPSNEKPTRWDKIVSSLVFK